MQGSVEGNDRCTKCYWVTNVPSKPVRFGHLYGPQGHAFCKGNCQGDSILLNGFYHSKRVFLRFIFNAILFLPMKFLDMIYLFQHPIKTGSTITIELTVCQSIRQ